MPLTPDSKHLDMVQDQCIALFDAGLELGAMELCARLMAMDGIPMHNPIHHFLLPAAMLTAANMRCGSPREKMIGDLAKARERSKDIPGGICGNNGCCGAAVAAGTFTSIWLNATPLSKGSWATANRITARALDSIASVDGPRCCKRNCFLALRGAIPVIRELLDVDLGSTDMSCAFHALSRECKKELCPFYPGE